MTTDTVVRARIDGQVKETAAKVLGEMGLSVSDAIRMLLVRVAAASVNPIDTYIRSGMVAMTLPKPFVPGCDFAGIVEAIGPDVHRIDCLVEVTEPTGPDTLAVMMLGGVEATARLRVDTNARPGEVCPFMVDMGKVCLFDPKSELRIT